MRRFYIFSKNPFHFKLWFQNRPNLQGVPFNWMKYFLYFCRNSIPNYKVCSENLPSNSSPPSKEKKLSYLLPSQTVIKKTKRIEFSSISFCFNSIHKFVVLLRDERKQSFSVCALKIIPENKAERNKKKTMRKLSGIKRWWIFILLFRCISGNIFNVRTGSEKVKKGARLREKEKQKFHLFLPFCLFPLSIVSWLKL